MKTVFVDIDNTICRTEGCRYWESVPIPERIERINGLFDKGHRIIYWTARGSGSGLDWSILTTTQLRTWGAKHHELRFGKPPYDLFIEDRSAFFNPQGLEDFGL